MQCIWSAWGESTMCGSVYVSIFRYVSSEGGQYCFFDQVFCSSSYVCKLHACSV